MIEMTWGEAGRPLVAVIGKGVVFDQRLASTSSPRPRCA